MFPATCTAIHFTISSWMNVLLAVINLRALMASVENPVGFGKLNPGADATPLSKILIMVFILEFILVNAC